MPKFDPYIHAVPVRPTASIDLIHPRSGQRLKMTFEKLNAIKGAEASILSTQMILKYVPVEQRPADIQGLPGGKDPVEDTAMIIAGGEALHVTPGTCNVLASLVVAQSASSEELYTFEDLVAISYVWEEAIGEMNKALMSLEKAEGNSSVKPGLPSSKPVSLSEESITLPSSPEQTGSSVPLTNDLGDSAPASV